MDGTGRAGDPLHPPDTRRADAGRKRVRITSPRGRGQRGSAARARQRISAVMMMLMVKMVTGITKSELSTRSLKSSPEGGGVRTSSALASACGWIDRALGGRQPAAVAAPSTSCLRSGGRNTSSEVRQLHGVCDTAGYNTLTQTRHSGSKIVVGEGICRSARVIVL